MKDDQGTQRAALVIGGSGLIARQESGWLSTPPTASRSPLPVPGRDGDLDRLISVLTERSPSTQQPAAQTPRLDGVAHGTSRTPIPPRNGEGGPRVSAVGG